MKTTYHLSYYHNSVMVIHVFGHMTYGCTFLVLASRSGLNNS